MSSSYSLKSDLDRICKGLAEKGEESIFVTVNLEKTTCFVMGSDTGLQWLDTQSAMVQTFYHFCADNLQSKLIEQEKDQDFTELNNDSEVSTRGPVSDLTEAYEGLKDLASGSECEIISESLPEPATQLDNQVHNRRKLFTKIISKPLNCKGVKSTTKIESKLASTNMGKGQRKIHTCTDINNLQELQRVNAEEKCPEMDGVQTVEKDNDQNLDIPMAVRRTRRVPKPKKLHQVECYVKLERLDKKVKDNGITNDSSVNLSEMNIGKEQNDKVSISNSCSSIDEVNASTVTNSIAAEDVKDELEGYDNFSTFLIDSEKLTIKQDTDNLYYSNEDEIDDGDDDDEDGDIRPKRTRSGGRAKRSRTNQGYRALFYNYINNMRSRVKRGKKRGVGHISCPTCDLTFNSMKGFKRHEKSCRSIKCPKCNCECPSIEDLEKHFETHKGEKLHRCQYCDKEFLLINTLKRHETTHRAKQKYSCPLCSKSVYTPSFLRSHIRQVHKEKRHICVDCGTFFDTEFEYNKHITKHAPNKKMSMFTCKKCGKMFEMLYYLKRHNRFYHRAKGERICKHCLEYFANDAKYKEHLREHEWDKPNTCVHCRQYFETEEMLNEHVHKIHNEGMKYICEVCGFQAGNSRGLKHHKLEHEASMPYTCKDCGQGFALKSKYDGHILNHTTEKLFVCETCGKKFKRRTTLRSHMIIHTAGVNCKFCERIFKSVGGLDYHILRCHADKVNIENYRKTLHKCEKCDKYFPSKPSYNQHMISHSTERSWECSVCQKKFKTERLMKEHKTNHDVTKPFFCLPCNHGFSSKPRWEAHLKTEKHQIQSSKPPEVIKREQEMKVAQKMNERLQKSEEIINVRGGQDIIIKSSELNPSAAATMINLPETTILIIGDSGHVEYMAEDVKASEGIQFIEHVEADDTDHVQETFVNEVQGVDVHHIQTEGEHFVTGEFDNCDNNVDSM